MNTRTQFFIPKKVEDAVLQKALKIARRAWVDELDCSKSFCRQKSSISIEELLELRKDVKYQTVFIFRNMSFLPQEFLDKDGKNPNRNYWDVGFYTLCNKIEYFLWIELEEEDGYKIVWEFKLKEL